MDRENNQRMPRYFHYQMLTSRQISGQIGKTLVKSIGMLISNIPSFQYSRRKACLLSLKPCALSLEWKDDLSKMLIHSA